MYDYWESKEYNKTFVWWFDWFSQDPHHLWNPLCILMVPSVCTVTF